MNNSNPFDTNPAQQTGPSMKLTELIYRVFDKAAIIIASAVIGAILMGIVAGTGSVTTYHSTSKLYLINTDDTTLSISDLQTANYLVNDYLAVFQTKELHQLVAKRVDLGYTPDQLSTMVSAGNVIDTHIINITVRADTSTDAQVLANTYADIAGSLVEEKLNVPKPVIFEKATSATKSVVSTSGRNYLVGAVVGLFLSCVGVGFHAVFDDRIYTPEDLKQAAGIETLGIMTKQRKSHPVRRRVK